jgi:hypothetical protein
MDAKVNEICQAIEIRFIWSIHLQQKVNNLWQFSTFLTACYLEKFHSKIVMHFFKKEC